MTTGVLTLDYARSLDADDPLAKYRKRFHIPQDKEGKDLIYLCGNSLGLQPTNTRSFIEQELSDWQRFGVAGHMMAKKPWIDYHEEVSKSMAKVVGGKTEEVVCMNSLTVNLHLMMVSFYRPSAKRFKILIEKGAFPSDQYAVASQLRFHGYDPDLALIEVAPDPDKAWIDPAKIAKTIEEEGDSIALVMLGGVNYLSGQLFDMESITQIAHKKGCLVGFDLAHAAGNVPLALHDWQVDFAVWCSYKYLNAGPGGIAGCFVHDSIDKQNIPRFEGWWGHNRADRFKMSERFEPMNTVEAWQLSNPPIFQLAALAASLEIFDEVGMAAITQKRKSLTGFLENLIDERVGEDVIQTPRDATMRGAQLSLKISTPGPGFLKSLEDKGVVCDFREPNIVRAAPAPLYNTYTEIYQFVEILAEELEANG